MLLTYVLDNYYDLYIYIIKFAVISELEKDHSTIETCCLKNVVIFIQKIPVKQG